mmetsp:Transcript_8764/g.11564  ORF Transcript_8764/g.11564 Transcript_8764/m.11564 type:complete len:106 (-) Transcript_8764:1026-1343(-)
MSLPVPVSQSQLCNIHSMLLLSLFQKCPQTLNFNNVLSSQDMEIECQYLEVLEKVFQNAQKEKGLGRLYFQKIKIYIQEMLSIQFTNSPAGVLNQEIMGKNHMLS